MPLRNALDKALAKRTDELKDVKLRGGILLKPLAVFEREDAGEHFTWNSWHMSGIETKSHHTEDSLTMLRSAIPSFRVTTAIWTAKTDVAMFQVAPMDEHGYFNFGPNASHMVAVCETSKIDHR